MTPGRNHLIDSLPRRDRDRLLAACETVPLSLGEVLFESGAQLRHLHFPTDGYVSLVAEVDTHPGLEVGMVGREGAVGLSLLLGVTQSPLRAQVLGAGSAWRIGAPAFRRELAASAALRRRLDRYVYALMAQTVAAIGCQRFHMIGARLARWLLMSHDRAQTASFHATHEGLAGMLGVRRVGITVAAGQLQRRGIIAYHRGELTVLDRAGLEGAACSCYGRDCAAYSTALGPL